MLLDRLLASLKCTREIFAYHSCQIGKGKIHQFEQTLVFSKQWKPITGVISTFLHCTVNLFVNCTNLWLDPS